MLAVLLLEPHDCETPAVFTVCVFRIEDLICALNNVRCTP